MRTSYRKLEHIFGSEEWRELGQLQGVGQSSVADPTIWAVISTLFFELLRDNRYGFRMKAPLSQMELYLAGCECLDNIDIMHIVLVENNYFEVDKKLQKARK